nr:uncharacterized protein LOC127488146 isoform X3 [Oryctolagus cuniculus]
MPAPRPGHLRHTQRRQEAAEEPGGLGRWQGCRLGMTVEAPKGKRTHSTMAKDSAVGGIRNAGNSVKTSCDSRLS